MLRSEKILEFFRNLFWRAPEFLWKTEAGQGKVSHLCIGRLLNQCLDFYAIGVLEGHDVREIFFELACDDLGVKFLGRQSDAFELVAPFADLIADEVDFGVLRLANVGWNVNYLKSSLFSLQK